MAEFSMPKTINTNKSQFSGHLLSDFLLFCSFILSHPLYFFYFIFFSPYLLKLLSFLSPLVITTSLLLLAFLTFSSSDLPESKVGAFILHKLQSREDEEDIFSFEELQVYKIVFESSTFNADENPLEESEEKCIEAIEATVEVCSKDSGKILTLTPSSDDFDENPGAVCDDEEFMEVLPLESFVEEKEEEEEEEKEVNPPCEEFKKVKEEEENLSTGRGSEAMDSSKIIEVSVTKEGIENDGILLTSKVVENSQSVGEYFSSNDGVGDFNYDLKVKEKNLGKLRANFGFRDQEEESNAKVDEKKKTLGQNLGIKEVENSKTVRDYISMYEKAGEYNYSPKWRSRSRKFGANFRFVDQEEEPNAEIEALSPSFRNSGSMRKEKEWRRTLACKLFEERHSVNADGTEGMDLLWERYETESVKTQGTKSSNGKKVKNSGTKYYEDDDEDEDVDEDGQLCCLQALKFSTGKMNLGMGRPNLVKFSKALKGFGWLHNVSKHGKKIYH